MAVSAPERTQATVSHGPRRAGDYRRIAFEAMGTQNEIVFAARSPATADAFEHNAQAWVADFEQRFSRFIPESVVGRVNRCAGRSWSAVDADAEELFALCDWYHWKTKGVFDPTLGPLLDLWDHRKTHLEVPSAEAIAVARSHVGWARVERRPGAIRLPEVGMRLDLGGVGKEYAVDRVFAMAQSVGIADIMVNFGHDLRVSGEPPEGGAWRIGLDHPEQPGQCWCGVALARGGALCGSGDYLRYMECQGRHYGHIIDPRNGQPVQNGCRAVWVVAPSCTEAGMLATAAFVLGHPAGLHLIEQTWQAAGCLWTEATLYQTRRFHDYVIP